MALHAVGAADFELWRGEPPRYHDQSVATFARVGTDGTAFKLTGSRGRQFTSELESWHRTYDLARDWLRKYRNLIGGNAQRVKFNGRDLYSLTKTKYLVIDVVEIDCRANVRLLGPGVNYAGGVSLVTRWTMVPVRDTET